MANMSYCRFRNTASDLFDCVDYMDDGDVSDEEHNARVRMIRYMIRALENVGALVDESDIIPEFLELRK